MASLVVSFIVLKAIVDSAADKAHDEGYAKGYAAGLAAAHDESDPERKLYTFDEVMNHSEASYHAGFDAGSAQDN